VNRERKALKEIEESVVLTDYLMAHNMDFDDLRNFTSKMVKQALEWKRGKQ